LIEENRVLRQQIGNRRLRFNDDQRRRLAVKSIDVLNGVPQVREQSNSQTAKGLTDPAALHDRKEAWAEAYRRTPHGKPVELGNAFSEHK
jgi:hypothetical protein